MNKLLAIIILSLFLYSCSESIQLDLNNGENNRLVVEGSITTEYKFHEVNLSRTADYFYNQPSQPESEADISITDGDTTIHLTETDTAGIYRTDIQYSGKPGKTYTLNIRLNNGEIYSASEKIIPIAAMDSVKCEYKKSDFPFDKNYYYNINVFAQENPEPGNFYQWEVYLNGDHITDTVRLKIIVDDELVNGVYINNWTVYRIPENKITHDTNELNLQMLSISKQRYDFFFALLFETDFSGGPFSGPPANVPSNISNGALGFFSASAVTETRIKILKK